MIVEARGVRHLAAVHRTAIIVALFVSTGVSAQGRFSAPGVNAPAREFEQRLFETPRNISFIVARALGLAHQTESESADDSSDSDESRVITTQSQGNAISGSVVVSPGVTADEIIIVNINEGDSTAIRR